MFSFCSREKGCFFPFPLSYVRLKVQKKKNSLHTNGPEVCSLSEGDSAGESPSSRGGGGRYFFRRTMTTAVTISVSNKAPSPASPVPRVL